MVPGSPNLWIDVTAEHSRVGEMPPAIAGRLTLVIREDTQSLIRMPEITANDNLIVSHRDVHLAEQGAARIVMTHEARGTAGTILRTLLAGMRGDVAREWLEGYAKSLFNAEALTSYETRRADDFEQPFQLRMDVAKGSRGYTNLDDATVTIPLTSLADRMPAFIIRREDEDAPPRTADVVFEPFVTEWRYRVFLPPGFQVRSLPDGQTRELGPARLTQEYSTQPGGTVLAVLRFDSVNGRYTVTEASAARKALTELAKSETVTLRFQLAARAKMNAGDTRGALQSYEELIALHPKEAIHRIQIAYALLELGLAERAWREAQIATQVQPKDVLAWRALSYALQHDAIGRRYGAGFDRDGALAAIREAQALDPDEPMISDELAALLEYDAEGRRYSRDAQLEAAINEHQARNKRKPDSATPARATSLAYLLFHAGRYGEVEAALPPGKRDAQQAGVLLAARAMLEGSAAALEESVRLGDNEKERSDALGAAFSLLTVARQYDRATDVFVASGSGRQQSAGTAQRIEMARATRRYEQIAFAATDPRSAAQRALATAFHNSSDAELLKVTSARTLTGISAHERDTLVRNTFLSMKTARGFAPFAPETLTDFALSNVAYSVEGEDANGYRIRLQLRVGPSLDTFVVKEEGQYKFLADPATVAVLGKMVLERTAAADLAGARQWLDWARDLQQPAVGDDALGGPLLPRFWKKNQEADRDTIELAAAALLAYSPWSAPVLPILRQARERAGANVLNIDLAIASAYQAREEWEPLLEVATRLTQAEPESSQAFRLKSAALQGLKRLDEMQADANARIARAPDDYSARYVLAKAAEERGAYEEIRVALRPVLASGRANASDYNQFAWYGLLSQPIDAEIVEAARSAHAQSGGRSAAIMHTLACVYAVSGTPKEARELLLQTFQLSGLERPEDAEWYGFGLIAEAHGDADSARRYYERVTKPSRGRPEASSVYMLSQQRLAALKKPARR